MKPNSTMCARFFHARLAWVIITPFGRPVVPDVYIRRWTSSAAAGTCATALGAGAQIGERRPPVGSRRRDARPHERGLDALRRLVRELDERLVAHERAGSGVLEDVPHLRRGEPPVDRHRDRAEVVGGEDRLQELGAVVREERHDVAAADAALGQAAGQRGRAVGHLAVGRRLALEDRDRLVRRAGRVVGEHGEPVHVRLHRLACVMPRPTSETCTDQSRLGRRSGSVAAMPPRRRPAVSTQGELGGAPPGDHRHVGAASSPGGGYHATGINELCTANELGKGALYHYIGSKEALLAAIHDRVMDEVMLGADRVAEAGGIAVASS